MLKSNAKNTSGIKSLPAILPRARLEKRKAVEYKENNEIRREGGFFDWASKVRLWTSGPSDDVCANVQARLNAFIRAGKQ